jgi:hypothetical protein
MARSKILSLGVLFVVLMLMPRTAAAQNTGIAGVARDTSGAVIPGVTVEAASPALIEKVRSAVTDEQGLYSIVDLRPGVYTVTFTLAGFSSVKREGIELTGSFTATVNAVLPIGGVAETITVSGETPTVDIRNVVQQRVLTDEVRETLPTGRSMLAMSEIIPGISITTGTRPSGHDVAGTSDVRGASTIHGGRPGDYIMQFDSAPITIAGNGGQQAFQVNPGEVQEYVFELGALSAETLAGGIRANIIPKEGGNRFTGYFFTGYANDKLQSSNLTDQLLALGVTTPNKLRSHWDVNGSAGGPVRRDRLWFFASFRNWGQHEEIVGMYHAIDPKSFVFDPRLGAAGNVDLSQPAVYESVNKAYSGRLTWQATPRNKLAFYGANQPRRNGLFLSGTRSLEAAVDQNIKHNRLLQATWKSPLTSRLLAEAMWADSYMPGPQGGTVPGLADSDIVSVSDLGTGYMYRSSPTAYYDPHWYQPSARAALSYVTGAHVAKFGFDSQWGYQWGRNSRHNLNMTYQFRNGAPIQITVFNEPWDRKEEFRKLAFFAQDQWTLKRLTVNGGLRLDLHKGSVPDDQTTGPNQYAPFQTWPAIENVPNWKDLSPRIGVAYDLFGDGKTAIKGTLNRYVVSDGVVFPGTVNPLGFNSSATRSWTDRNGDFVPQESELGTLSNSAFGTAVSTSRTDDRLREGWFVRAYNWETSASVQHQLIPEVSVNIGYTRRWFGNFTVTDNLALVPADHDEFCITAPTDARLGGVSSSRICGLYDLNPTKRTVTPDNVRTSPDTYGTQKESWQGIDATVNARLPRRVTVSGGLSSGTEGNNSEACFVIDSPGVMRFCDVKRPWRTGVRFLGTIGMPWGIDAGVTFQGNPGPEILANYTVTSAQVGSTVQFVNPARTSFSGGSAAVSLIEPGTMFGDYMYQLDLRLIKALRYRRVRARLTLDLANILNASAVLVQNNAYGTSWLRPVFTLQGRLIKPGVQIDF